MTNPARRGARRAGRRARVLLCGLVALSLGAAPAAATTVVAKSFQQLCAEADLIFVGTVAAVRSGWVDEQRGRIETAVTFSDLQWLRGSGDALTLRFAGGEVDGITEVIGGMPHFRVGQRSMLFARSEPSISPIVGFHQGCLGVVRGAGGEVVTSADGRPVEAIDESGFQLGEAGASLAAALPLAAVIDAVESCLRAAESDE